MPIQMPPPDPTIRAVVNQWCRKINHARKHKKALFQDEADQCQSFFSGPRNWDDVMLFQSGEGRRETYPDPTFRISVNKAAELVQLFGPAMYQNNPHRTVSPRKQPDIPGVIFGNPAAAQMQAQAASQQLVIDTARAAVIESYLNWTPRELDLRQNSRDAIDEALIKGRGCLWTEIREMPLSDQWVVGSFFDSVDNLFIDPDAESVEQACWIARQCCHPVWFVERLFNLPPGSIPTNASSQAQIAEERAPVFADSLQANWSRRPGCSNDLVVYYKIYSKMGIGGRLSGLPKNMRPGLEIFGDYCYLAIVDGLPWPLNLPPTVQSLADFDVPNGATYHDIMQRVSWPIPFWADGKWPVSCLDFHKVPRQPWPKSHLSFGLPELKFINWTMSFLLSRIHNSSRSFCAIRKEAGDEIKDALLSGEDFTLLKLDPDQLDINELIRFLDHPQVNNDVWKIVEKVEQQFERRTGLNELMYGETTTQIRSAEEAALKNQNISVRPGDMAEQVESWMAHVAENEAMASRYFLRGADIYPVFGQATAAAWDAVVSTTDISDIVRQLEYKIESGSTRKPDRNRALANADQAAQVLMPVLQANATQTGNVSAINQFLVEWCKSRDIDPPIQLVPPPPPMPPPQAPAPPPPGR